MPYKVKIALMVPFASLCLYLIEKHVMFEYPSFKVPSVDTIKVTCQERNYHIFLLIWYNRLELMSFCKLVIQI
jgi:hypothetical protein